MSRTNYLDINPSELIKYMNKHVRVYLKSKNSSIEGSAYTIDPVSMRLLFKIISTIIYLCL